MIDIPATTPPESAVPSYPETAGEAEGETLRLSSIPIMPAASATYTGATKGEGLPPDALAAGQDLPMMVWLRGDEDICSEFSMDAEAVMARLGIRRSRLTQIAGRELRVGRMRKGRYVSPVFRLVDVEAYLNWTRASASHVKSSGLLQDAAEELMQQSERLSERLEAVPQEMAEIVSLRIAQATFEITKLMDEHTGNLHADLLSQKTLVMESGDRLQQHLLQQTAQIEGLREVVAAQQLHLQILLREMSEMAALGRVMRGESKAFREQVLELLAEEEPVELPQPPAPLKRPQPRLADARRIKTGTTAPALAAATPWPRRPRHRKPCKQGF